MGFMDILEQYAGQAMAAQGDPHADFSKVAERASPDALGAVITEALIRWSSRHSAPRRWPSR